MSAAPAWMPSRYTAPLSEDFTSDWDRWEPFFLMVWRVAYGIELAPFQRWLLRHILETYPPGHARAGELRYRQVIVSVARQNTKSDIAAILSIWGLLRKVTGGTLGIASNVDQAKIVYTRCRDAITRNPTLAARFARTTDTRGLATKDGSTYSVKPAKSAALQGFPVGTGIVDELHLVLAALWGDLVNGTGARRNAIVIGITTAGDDGSELLLDLYGKGAEAIAAEPEKNRLGFFVWEASEATVPEDDDELLALLMQANPMLASGLVDPEVFLSDVRATPGGPTAIIRYRLNRFVKGTAAAFLDDPGMWARCARDPDEPRSTEKPVFFIDVSPNNQLASIVAGTLDKSNKVFVELVAAFVEPTTADLMDAIVKLRRHGPKKFGVDSSQKALIAELKVKGIPHEVVTGGEWVAASNLVYSRVKNRTLFHENDQLINSQLPVTMRKSSGDSYRISRVASGAPIDSVMAMVGATYVAELSRNTFTGFVL